MKTFVVLLAVAAVGLAAPYDANTGFKKLPELRPIPISSGDNNENYEESNESYDYDIYNDYHELDRYEYESVEQIPSKDCGVEESVGSADSTESGEIKIKGADQWWSNFFRPGSEHNPSKLTKA